MNSPQRAVPVRDRFYARTFALVTALVLGIALFKIVQPFLGPLLWAIFIAFLLHPLHVRLTRRLQGPAAALGGAADGADAHRPASAR